MYLKIVSECEVELLQSISRQTFYETFSDLNTVDDMQHYLENALSRTQLQAELLDPGMKFYFAMRGEELLGYMKLNFGAAQKEKVEPGGVELERIYVLQKYLGQGIGQFLLDEAMLLAKQFSTQYLWLGVWEKNDRAIRFYQKNGFEPFGSHVFKLGNDEQNDVLMKKLL